MLRLTPSRRAQGSSLGVICGTNHPGPLVASLLSHIRNVADEVIVGADERVGETDLRWYGSVADVLVTFPWTGPNQFRGWLREKSRCDWLLFLDGDELVSEDLLQSLPQLVSDRYVAAYELARQWVFTNGGRCIKSAPWWPDYQTRLVRNDDRLWFPSVKHSGPACAGPHRRAKASIVHLDLILRDEDARRQKVQRYDAEEFGLLTAAGQPVNETYYLPEDQGGLTIAELDPADRRRVESAIQALAFKDPPQSFRAVSSRATVKEIRRTIPWERLTEDDRRGTITILDCPHSVPAGVQFNLTASVSNLGGRTWPSGAGMQPGIRCAQRWFDVAKPVIADGVRAPLPHPLRPGEETEVELTVTAPHQVGELDLVLDILAEGDLWFGIDARRVLKITEHPRDALMSQAKDGVVSLDAALAMRRHASKLGDISRYLIDPEPRSEIPTAVAAALDGLSFGGWAIDVGVAGLLIDHYRQVLPLNTVEFGSGTSTVLLATLARQIGREGATVVAFEQDEEVAYRLQDELQRRNLAATARVVFAPIRQASVGGVQALCYDADTVGQVLQDASPGLVFIDGPSLQSGASRFPTLLLVQGHLPAPALFLMDDAWRDAELTIAERWRRMPGIEVQGIVPVGKGAIIGTVRRATGR